MKKVRIVGLPRRGDPAPQRQLWLGMELSVIPHEPEDTEGNLIWVDYEEVIRAIEAKGDIGYANFFKQLRRTPGGSQAPGLLVERAVCEEIK